jgi:predicted lipoprotein with Yx(FWY)xxD motif
MDADATRHRAGGTSENRRDGAWRTCAVTTHHDPGDVAMAVRRTLILGLPLALAIGACSGDATASIPPSEAPPAAPTEAPSVAPPTDAPTTEPTEAPTEAPAAAATVALADNPLGTILVDPAGRTLYGFTADVDGIPTCYEQCAENWPPLLADGVPAAGDGLDPALLTSVPRSDGPDQVKYGDWPLYLWAADAAPGDATGQGVGGVWFVVGADGGLIGQ